MLPLARLLYTIAADKERIMVDQPGRYAIHVQESLSSLDSVFDWVEVRPGEDGGSVLIGDFPDQAALHGVLARIRDLCLTLISVERIR